MKRLILVGALGITLTLGSSVLSAQEVTAMANLAPPDGSQGITAALLFQDNGKRLRVTGTAAGMDPNKHYHSLIYDAASAPSGPNACIPTVLPPIGGLSFDQMQLGSWQPIGSSNRTLTAIRKIVAYVPLEAIGTSSIRRHDQTGPAAALPLVSCGAVVPQ